jgi:hypothetical protein
MINRMVFSHRCDVDQRTPHETVAAQKALLAVSASLPSFCTLSILRLASPHRSLSLGRWEEGVVHLSQHLAVDDAPRH